MFTTLIRKTFKHFWKWTQSLLVLLIFTVLVWRNHELQAFIHSYVCYGTSDRP
jgi:hypothetical protein